MPSFANAQQDQQEEPELVEIEYTPRITNTDWQNFKVDPSFYEDPFQMSLFSPQNGEDSERLWSQTKSIFTFGFAVIGVIALLPEDISNWEKGNILGKWDENVKNPVWDRDGWVINVVGHGYFGGVYYQAARKSGYRQWDSFLYSTLMSTFYWEFGIEAFAEKPSIQDLWLTPVIGWGLGEWMYQQERSILADNGEVWGSETLGSVTLAVLIQLMLFQLASIIFLITKSLPQVQGISRQMKCHWQTVKQKINIKLVSPIN